MRGGPLEDPETGEVTIDPLTNKAVMIPPRGVTALDVIKKFDRSMTLEQAITYLRKLEYDDRLITRSEIEDGEFSGASEVFHYRYKRKNRER